MPPRHAKSIESVLQYATIVARTSHTCKYYRMQVVWSNVIHTSKLNAFFRGAINNLVTYIRYRSALKGAYRLLPFCGKKWSLYESATVIAVAIYSGPDSVADNGRKPFSRDRKYGRSIFETCQWNKNLGTGKQRLIFLGSQMEIVPGHRSPVAKRVASLQVRWQKRSEINLISCAISSCRHERRRRSHRRRRRRRSYPCPHPKQSVAH